MRQCGASPTSSGFTGLSNTCRAASCLWLPLAGLLGAAGPVSSQVIDATVAQVTESARKTDNVASLPAGFSITGVTIRLGDTNFYQGLVAESEEQSAQFGGKLDVLATVDLNHFGLWSGLSLTTHAEYNYGESVNHAGDTLLPVNTALSFPGTAGQSDLASLYLTQRFGTSGSLSLGKINMLDQAANTPLRGGGGISTFQNIGVAAPVTGLVPPYIFGAIGRVKTPFAVLSVILFDPQSAVRTPPDHLFESGVNILGSLTLPVSPFGLTGYQSVKLVGSSQKSVDLRDVPQLILPQDTPPVLRGLRTPSFASYSFQQYLIHDETDRSRGWGLFGEVGVSDGNPTPISRSGYIGIGGSSLFAGREQDGFGIAYFRYSLSTELRNILKPLGNIRDETGIEAFYNVKILPWLNVSADVQVIEPALPGLNSAVFVGLRTRIEL